MSSTPHPSPSDRPSVVLLEALTQRLAAEIKLDLSAEAIAAQAGMDVAEVAALPPLTPEQEAQLDRNIWQPVAESCISHVLHVLFDEAKGASNCPRVVRFVDEDIDAIVRTHIAAPFQARHFGLDDARRRRAAELTAELFCDRLRFTQSTPFDCDGQTYVLHRDGDALIVQAQ